MDTISLLAEAGEQFAVLLPVAQRDAADRVTPCDPWTVGQLVNHVVAGNLAFTALVAGAEPVDWSADHLGTDWSTAHRASLADVITAFRRPEVATGTYRAPMGEVPGSVLVALRAVEHVVHGWDVARTTGQPVEPFDSAAEGLLDVSAVLLRRVAASGRRPFGPSQEVRPTAPAVDRLVAMLGRDPGWSAAN